MRYTNQIETYFSKLYKHKVIQLPNPPILAFFLFSLLAFITPSESYFQHVMVLLTFGSVFTWAWLELFYGANALRRTLGVISFLFIIAGGIYILY